MGEFAKTARAYAQKLREKANELDRIASFSDKLEGGRRVYKGWPKGKPRKPKTAKK